LDIFLYFCYKLAGLSNMAKINIRKKIIFALLLSLSCCWLVAQCPTDITFSSQGMINSFPIHYPGCTQILGNTTIAESDYATITHLDSLLQINYIKDLNVLHNAALTSLSGLANLTTIGGGLSVYYHSTLKSLSGLDNMDFSMIITGRGSQPGGAIDIRP
jgi:hypothetical protein